MQQATEEEPEVLTEGASEAAGRRLAPTPDYPHTCNICGDMPIQIRRWRCTLCVDFDLCNHCHSTALEMHQMGHYDTGPHTPEHPMLAYNIQDACFPKHSGKLSAVVDNAIRRWFGEALRGAKAGDPQQMMMVSQMYLEGYGVEASNERARYWQTNAKRHGARRLEGVYDRLP